MIINIHLASVNNEKLIYK